MAEVKHETRRITIRYDYAVNVSMVPPAELEPKNDDWREELRRELRRGMPA